MDFHSHEYFPEEIHLEETVPSAGIRGRERKHLKYSCSSLVVSMMMMMMMNATHVTVIICPFVDLACAGIPSVKKPHTGNRKGL